MSEPLRSVDWASLYTAERRVEADSSWADLIVVIATAAIGLSLSFIAIAMFGLPVATFAAMG